ncbi:hypothetical protein PFISCL1PPCAC_5009 [Pristionchus fissidentatus]|uniref:Uncharacterized protein n=1 Tax=Pristionchus fissidentatus TaxID=1538716 RepID=A0AAV5V4G7_9BILA|nr:hypothetical protein PFISCL1PPCAC_5009 [Pristionchus fissidentatus]
MLRSLLLTALVSSAAAQLSFPNLFPAQQPCCGGAYGGYYGQTTTAEPTTTEDPNKSTTTNGYQALGWETDDDGNVFWGNDIAKIFLYQMPAEKYWAPIPKDWPEGPMFGSHWPDSPNYRAFPPGYATKGIQSNIPDLITALKNQGK